MHEKEHFLLFRSWRRHVGVFWLVGSQGGLLKVWQFSWKEHSHPLDPLHRLEICSRSPT